MHGVPELRLGGVDLAAATELVGRAGYDVEPEVVRALCDMVAGNPLALLELPGVLDADQRAGRRPLDDQLTVTASVERAFLARVGRLDPEGRRALLLAAASDSDDVETVRHASPEAAAGLERAERIGLVRVQQGRIGFWHPLVRSAVYSAATDEERRAAHRALAAGLSEEHPARRAWHLVAAGAEPDNDVSADLADAGLAARRRGACASAARLLERAASVTPDQELRARRLLLAGQAAWLDGQLRRADALLDLRPGAYPRRGAGRRYHGGALVGRNLGFRSATPVRAVGRSGQRARRKPPAQGRDDAGRGLGLGLVIPGH
jgi:hypothetical protein